MMWRPIITLLCLLPAFLAAFPCRAAILLTTAAGPPQLCRPAISAAERAHGIPLHLLAAIGRVESGRKDPASGSFNPWPWTVNAEGQGYFYDSKAQAVAAVQDMRTRGMRSIDVGCMQISLLHHPDAFGSLEQAFDPSANADYGARFLGQLYERSNAWPRAVELYHSATPELGQDYGRKVYAALPEEERLPGLPAASTLASAWSATINRPPALSPFSSAFRPSPGRIIPMSNPFASASGTISPGRTLESYRAMPVRLAFRAQ